MKNNLIIKLVLFPLFYIFAASSVYSQQIYFVDNQTAQLRKSDNNGSNLTDLITGSKGLYGAAVDFAGNKLFYTNVVTDEIFTASLDGSGVTLLLSSGDGINGPRGIAFDGQNNKIYWAEALSGKIKKADANGSNITDVIIGLSSPVDVSLDLVNNKLYWSDNGSGQKKISRSNLDGTSIEDIITGIDQVGGIEVDAANGKLYWVDFGATDKIQRANVNGTSPEILVTIPAGSPRGVAIDKENDKLFWSDVVDGSISSATRNGTSQLEILSTLSHPLGISSVSNTSLPVELVSFSALRINNTVQLRWNTETEKENYGFEIERSSKSSKENEYNWVQIGFIPGSGNSNVPNEYSFTDKNISDDELMYRLKQIDKDGAYYYSNIIMIESVIPMEFSLSQNYPNPFNPGTIIRFSLPQSEFVTLKIYDMLGKEVSTLVNEKKDAGTYTVNFDGSFLSSGIYFYELKANSFTQKMKMLLIK